MFRIDNRELRNLEEQVLKNKQDIANHYAIDRSLANFGIKIVGTVASVDDLPNPLTYAGVYGDGYAVGKPGEYTYYIYTRPDPNSGHPENYWLDVGQISIVGPQGPQGETGERGPAGESSKWYIGDSFPTNAKENDMLINSTGKVFQYTANSWVYVTELKGPQGVQGIQGPQGERGETGPQGPQGQRGDVGGLVNIAGALTSEEQLPTPASLDNLTIAYLINGDLYIQLGTAPTNAQWYNAGPFNVGTMVTVDGVYQNVWDANTKAPAHPTSGTTQRIYTSNGTEGGASWVPVQVNAYTTSAGTVVTYAQEFMGDEEARAFLLTKTPTKLYHAANKKYVDDELKRYHGKPVKAFSWEGELASNQKASMTYLNMSESLFRYETLDIIIKLKSGALISKQIYPQSFTYSDIHGDIYGYNWSFIDDGQKINYKIVQAQSPSPSFEVTNYSAAENSKIVRIDVVAYRT